MKQLLIVICAVILMSCGSDDHGSGVAQSNLVTFNFSHNWDDTPVTNSDFDVIQFTNASGDMQSIERLRYLISNVTFTKNNSQTLKLQGYNLVDLEDPESLLFSPITSIPIGEYTNVSFTFGFTNEDNVDGVYTDLNSASFNVPDMLGGGYHYMQLDGKFINSTNAVQGYNYHAIHAVDASDPNNVVFPQDTFITVNLGAVIITNNATFNIKMNIAEWFKTPNIWDLNQYNQMLMPNPTAQILMSENGQNVFTLDSVSQ